MKNLAIVLTAILITGIFAYAQTASSEPSLAELAEQERERRSKIEQPAPLITNESLATMGRARVSQAKSLASIEEPLDEDEPSETQGADAIGEEKEVDWTKLFSEATLAYRTAINNHLVLQLRLNNLRNAFFNEDDGTTQSLVQTQMQETTENLEANAQLLEETRQKIVDLQQAAEHAGLTPGEVHDLTGELPEPELIFSTTTPTP